MRVTFTFCLGGLAFYFFLLLIATGVLLMFYYRYGDVSPYLSVREIAEIVPFGGLIRNLHYWCGQGIVLLILGHMVRVVITGSYQRSREWVWVIGMGLLALVFFMDFSGYLLRFDKETFWAGYVALGVVKEIPYVGETLHSLVTGTATYGEASAQRIYIWHCVVLPLAGLSFMFYHFWKVSRLGYSARVL
jgi:quinol-cytochrome oxidoreductase complex cytochrome b subunit